MNEEKKEEHEESRPGVDDVLSEMKSAGIEGAVIRNDGVLVSSTMALEEGGAKLISSFNNVIDAMLRSVDDSQREVEISVDSKFLMIIPMRQHMLCGVLSKREKKDELRGYADRMKLLL